MKPLFSVFRPNPAVAEAFRLHLIRLRHYRAEQRGDELVTLGEEIAYTRSWTVLLELLQAHSWQVHLPREAVGEGYWLLPFTLQTILEELLLNRVATPKPVVDVRILPEEGGSEAGGNAVCLAAGGPYLAVMYDRSGQRALAADSAREAVPAGLVAIQQRYAQRTSRPVSISQQEHQVHVKIPLLSDEFRYL